VVNNFSVKLFFAAFGLALDEEKKLAKAEEQKSD
jgi:hypothetical protein